MSRGKYAVRSLAQEHREMRDQFAVAQMELTAERAKRDQEKRQHAVELADTRAAVAVKVAESMRSYTGDQIDYVVNGVSAVTWRACRVAMTEHLAWLFFKGYLKWDRLEGDREVLTYIATHGDIDTWWTLTAKYGHRKTRPGMRDAVKAQERHTGFLHLVMLNRDIAKALNGDARLLAERKALDDTVEQATSAFLDVALSEVRSSEKPDVIEPSEDAVAIYQTVMAGMAEYLDRAPGAST